MIVILILTNLKQNTVKEKEIITDRIDGVFQSNFFVIFACIKNIIKDRDSIFQLNI